MYHGSWLEVKPWDSFLRCWRPIISILVITEGNSCSNFSQNYLPKQKYFSEVLLHFWNLDKILIVFKKKIIVIAQIFWKLLIPKNVVPWLPERCCVGTPIGSRHVKWSETLLQSLRHHFYANFRLISNRLSCVGCLLVTYESLGLFSNMLTADHKYSCHNWQKFPQ